MTYDHWKTTPPDWMQDDAEPTPEQEAEAWFDDWFGMWLSDMDDDGYEVADEEWSADFSSWFASICALVSGESPNPIVSAIEVGRV